MATDPYLISVMDAQQTMFTPVTNFQLNEYCYWVIAPPNEYQADVKLKIRIDSLTTAECYLNFGGSITSANEQTQCYEGNTYEFDYYDKDKVSNVYLVTVATANNAHIRFSYWAESKISIGGLIAIVVGGIGFMSLAILGLLILFIDRSVKKSLEPVVGDVKHLFTETIEKIEPGTLKSQREGTVNDQSSLNLVDHR
eukprot:403365752